MSARHQHSGERTLIDDLLADQQNLTAVERFSALHDRAYVSRRYSSLLPAKAPGPGEQYAFEVNLDACTGCKACVAACHSLNGLDEEESFRDVGMLLGKDYQQTVTTACHHCADPACANGCPVKAYEKDAETGIVKHLDDQCIGCQYCMLKCPYEVPKYNERLGIVRKCDMCSQRLAIGEAPACVQACPTNAISIRIVKTDAFSTTLVPGAFDPSYTQPTTHYASSQNLPTNVRAADADVLRVQHTHWPLVIMLLLTQLSAGWFVTALWEPAMIVPACVALFAGLGASVLHLGRPMGAWRFFLGLRKSWMSREILLFSLLAGAAPIAVFIQGVRLPLALGGLIAVFTSAMIYIDTRRSWWNASRTFASFFGTVTKLGVSGTAASLAVTQDVRVFTALALGFGLLSWLSNSRLQAGAGTSVEIVRKHLSHLSSTQHVCAVSAMIVQATALMLPTAAIVLAPLAFIASLVSCTCERVIFFKAVDAPKMPGGLTA